MALWQPRQSTPSRTDWMIVIRHWKDMAVLPPNSYTVHQQQVTTNK